MKTSKELRTAYKNLEADIEESFDALTESTNYNFLRKTLANAGEAVHEMDEDEMVERLDDMELQVHLPCILYYSVNKYKDISGMVLSIQDGIVYVLEEGDNLITDIVKFRNLSLTSRISLIIDLEDYNNEEE